MGKRVGEWDSAPRGIADSMWWDYEIGRVSAPSGKYDVQGEDSAPTGKGSPTLPATAPAQTQGRDTRFTGC